MQRLLLCLVLVTFAGCGTPESAPQEPDAQEEADLPPSPRVRSAQRTRLGQTEAGPTVEQQGWQDKNCPLGKPKRSSDWDHGPTVMVYREGYVLEHSSLDKIPLWVCELVTQEQISGSIPRKDAFEADPQLEGKPRSELSDYKRSGYDRGHLAPAGNQTVDAELKRQTFYLSNMAPQVGAMNQQIWRELEDLTRVWVERKGDAYEITGTMFYDPKEDDPSTADGVIDYYMIGSGVAIPTHFYKIVITAPSGGTAPEAIAFVAENRAYKKPSGSDVYDWKALIRSIDWVEERTGLDFMPNLAPEDEARMEGQEAALWK